LRVGNSTGCPLLLRNSKPPSKRRSCGPAATGGPLASDAEPFASTGVSPFRGDFPKISRSANAGFPSVPDMPPIAITVIASKEWRLR
jgi:hypothetical protein